jgi:hypothetical protein
VALIGELLVQDGLITEADVEAALEHGRQRRLRLASALVALGRISIDEATRALAAQHGVPAALEKHLAGRDVALSGLLSGQLAWSLGALPLAYSRGKDAIVVCVRDPIPSAALSLERATQRPVLLAVAVEIALLPLIAETYPIAKAPEGAPVEVEVELDTGPVRGLDPDTLELVDLDHQAVAKDPAHAFSSPAIALPTRVVKTLALDPALVAIAAAGSGDEVVDAILAFLHHRFGAGLVFVVKDGLALGQGGFADRLDDDTIAALVLPLSQPSVLRAAHDGQATLVGPPGEHVSHVQERFFRLFGSVPFEVVVVPVIARSRVVNLIYAHGPRGATMAAAAAELGTLSTAAGEALVRIVRESKESE